MIKPTVDLGYPTEAHGRIPAFQNIEEEAAFWDTHDFTDYHDESTRVEITVGPAVAEHVSRGSAPIDWRVASRGAAAEG